MLWGRFHCQSQDHSLDLRQSPFKERSNYASIFSQLISSAAFWEALSTVSISKCPRNHMVSLHPREIGKS